MSCVNGTGKEYRNTLSSHHIFLFGLVPSRGFVLEVLRNKRLDDIFVTRWEDQLVQSSLRGFV